MGVPPKGRAERPAFRAAAILSPSILSSALRLLPFFFAAPFRGGLGTRASSSFQSERLVTQRNRRK